MEKGAHPVFKIVGRDQGYWIGADIGGDTHFVDYVIWVDIGDYVVVDFMHDKSVWKPLARVDGY